jgi:glycosyltransferase involved in cell wall biosynthesis
MKVTLLTTSFPLTRQSTSGIFVARLVDKLAEIADVIVVTPADKEVKDRLKRCNANIVPCRYAPKNWQRLAHEPGGMPVATRQNPWLWLLLPGLILSLGWHCLREARHSDVIHANWAMCGFIAGIAGWLLGKPVVTTLRGDDVTRAEKNKMDMLLLGMCIQSSRKIICVSSDMLDWLAISFPEYKHKTTLIENGVDDAFIKAGESRSTKKVNDEIRLITVGSLIPRKGIDLILNACAQLPGHLNYRLMIAGSGPEEQTLRCLAASLNITSQVDFTSMLAPENVPEKLQQADIFILASHSEGRPNVLLEAMAAGLPVIASDIRGVKELIKHEHTGLLFRDGEMQNLAELIQLLVVNRELQYKLGQAGRKLILDGELTWAKCAEKYSEIYKESIRNPVKQN